MPSPFLFACDTLFQHVISGLQRPFLANCKLTNRFNLLRQQCAFVDRPGLEPSFTQVTALLDQLSARGDRIIIFEGGEPLLWRYSAHTFANVAAYARSRFAVTGVTTNGTQPLDGFAETHNRLRGAPIFERVNKNMRSSAHSRVFAHLTANAENHLELPSLVRLLRPLVKGITVQFYCPYGAEDRLFLPWLERCALLAALIELKRQGFPKLNSAEALHALMANSWHFQPWRINGSEPDGHFWRGCYVEGRVAVDCKKCGFSPYTEISPAFQGHPHAILAGMRIFGV